MKVRNLITIILINIFLMIAVSVVNEYIDLRKTLQQMSSTVQMSVDFSLDTSVRSEEFFSEDYAIKDASGAVSGGTYISSRSKDGSRNLVSTTSLYRNGTWFGCNSYILGMYYEQFGELPDSKSRYDSYASGLTVQDIYTYLFGNSGNIFGSDGLGSEYNSSSLSWANQTSGYVVTSSNLRKPSSEFKSFYDSVGKLVERRTAVKVKDGSSYKVEYEYIPVLTNMGLQLNDFNKVTSIKTSDNFTSLVHKGYVSNRVGEEGKETNYMLTPYSLGVTYVPASTFKATLLSNLENFTRFNKCKTNSTGAVSVAYDSADGCMTTEVYDGGVDATGRHVGSPVSQNHISGGSHIVNDGNVEYDLDSLQTKIEYFDVNFYDDANWRIVNYIEGSTPGEDPRTLPSRLAAKDTNLMSLPSQGIYEGTSEYSEAKVKAGTRIVAKVTTKVRVHIPYKSAFLQWAAHLGYTAGEEHYDIPLWNVNTDSIVEDSNGVWYVYTTYKAISR